MSDALLVGLVVVAALACPLHMWWMHRRGKRAACCPPQHDHASTDVAALRARRDELEAQLAEFDLADEAPATPARR